MSFSLGSLTINVQDWAGFDYPENAVVTPLLGDGSGATGNAVVQQTALALKEAKISGVLQSTSDVSTLRGYYQAKTETTFVDAEANSTTIRVFDLVITRLAPLVWTYACRLVESL